ncbi:hypothetical protein [Acidicapsa acidisoli]|uniref:hypothetical protein n=1 Tax=Acidicapsa acidisoli TaxID=1615681 RepID=UPI0021E06099|nr:hypothetical protein [Acidicapsa acidisoli]
MSLFLFTLVIPAIVKADSAAQSKAASELLTMAGKSTKLGNGQFDVLDAKLAAGIADPPEYARQWGSALEQCASHSGTKRRPAECTWKVTLDSIRRHFYGFPSIGRRLMAS